MQFSEMPYSRPNVDQIKSQLADLTDRLRRADTYPKARQAFLEKEALASHVETLSSLAHIRHSIDTRDPFYQQEDSFWNRALPEIEEYLQEWIDAMLFSPFRRHFAREYGELMFLNAEISRQTFSPDIISQLQEENDLVQTYEKLLAGAQIPFEDNVYTLSQIAPFKNDPDDERRLAAWKAEGQWYKAHQQQLDSLYDDLVRLRDEMGKTLGYGGFIPLGYFRMGRNCYTHADVEKFREAVVRYLVPVADSIFRRHAQRLRKTYPMSFADNALQFRSGNAKPCGSAEAIIASAARFYDTLSPETSRFFREMQSDRLFDLLSTEGKEGGGYCTSLPDYKVPFIFANFNGTRDDVETVTHEAGHAFAAWLNMDRVPMSTVWPSMEACEVHSMSMEFFAWKSAEDFFGADARKFRYSHLASCLTFIPYGTMVDHFQHLVYENPNWTPRDRHEAWKKLLGIYTPWQKLDGEIPFYSEGEGWQRQHHIYSFPFYYIDYCFAQTVALEFWAQMQDDYDAAWQRYLAFAKQGGSRTFVELLQHAGLASPFDENCLRTVCEKAAKWLEEFDISGIE